jgi:hypothetical protein
MVWFDCSAATVSTRFINDASVQHTIHQQTQQFGEGSVLLL